jgi:hypothetical protein
MEVSGQFHNQAVLIPRKEPTLSGGEEAGRAGLTTAWKWKSFDQVGNRILNFWLSNPLSSHVPAEVYGLFGARMHTRRHSHTHVR